MSTACFEMCGGAKTASKSTMRPLLTFWLGTKLAKNTAPGAPNSWMLSEDYTDIVGFLDGSSIPVARTTGNANQELVWNHYYFQHMLLLQSITFPGGICVIDVKLGFHADISAWTYSPMRQQMLQIRAQHEAAIDGLHV